MEAIEKEIINFKKKLIEVETNKANLEEAIDNLPLDTKYRERKLTDMSKRLDGLYETIVELEENIADATLRKTAMEEEAITLENIYKLLLSFNEVYDIMSDEEKKDLISYLIKDVQIYANDEEAAMPLKSITLNFPIYIDNREVKKLLWDKQGSVDWIVINNEPKNTLLSYVNSIIDLVNDACLIDGWTKSQLESVTNEFENLKTNIEKNKLIFKYGKKQRMLESTYILTESMKPISQTLLGCKIIRFQEILNKF